MARRAGGELAGKRVVAFDVGYVLWIAASDQGEVFTCNHQVDQVRSVDLDLDPCLGVLRIWRDVVTYLGSQDDGYAGTLANKRKPNEAGELGRDGDPFVPMQARKDISS